MTGRCGLLPSNFVEEYSSSSNHHQHSSGHQQHSSSYQQQSSSYQQQSSSDHHHHSSDAKDFEGTIEVEEVPGKITVGLSKRNWRTTDWFTKMKIKIDTYKEGLVHRQCWRTRYLKRIWAIISDHRRCDIHVTIEGYYSVKALNSGHLRISKNLSVIIKRCPPLGGNLTKIVTFGTKHFVRYSRYVCCLGCLLLGGFTVVWIFFDVFLICFLL